MSASDDLFENIGRGTPGAQVRADTFHYSEAELSSIADAAGGGQVPASMLFYLEEIASEFLGQAAVAVFKKPAIELDRRLAAIERAAVETHNLLLELGNLSDTSEALLEDLASSAEAEREFRREYAVVGNAAAPDRQWLLLRLIFVAHKDLLMPVRFSRRSAQFGQEPYGPIIDFLVASAGPPMRAKGQRMTAEIAANAVMKTRKEIAAMEDDLP